MIDETHLAVNAVPLRKPPVALALRTFARHDELDPVLVFRLRDRLDQDLLGLLGRIPSDNDDRELIVISLLLFLYGLCRRGLEKELRHAIRYNLRRHALLDVALKIPLDELRRIVRQRAVTVDLPVEIPVDLFGREVRLHEANMASEILSLDMEARRHRNAVLFAYRDSLPRQREGHQQMHDVRAFDRFLKDLRVGLRRHNFISCKRRIDDGTQIHSRHDAEPALALFVSVAANDSDIMPLRLQMIDQIVSCDARAVVRLAEHIAYDRYIHTIRPPYLRHPHCLLLWCPLYNKI